MFWVAGTVARNTVDAYRYDETCMYTNNSSCFGLRVQSEETVENAPPGEDAAAALEASEMTSQNVTFLDNARGEEFVSPKVAPGTALVDGTEDLQLGSFFSRPTLINTFTWTTANIGVTLATFYPWNTLLSSTAIKKKLDNFAFLRGTLNIKTVVNGTPFQYGLMRMCYSPLEGFVGQKLRTNSTTDANYPVFYSQQPGYYMTPAANAGGHMTCPFVLHLHWLDITSSTAVTTMGTCRLVMFWPLSLAVAGGTTGVTIQTYAWLTDLELMASTSKLSLQGDEYVEGPISGPATAVANVAAQLTRIPVIGKFARATQIGAGALANVARIFGYTNAPVIEDVKMFVPANGPQLASAHIGTPVQKLTLDPKQELSIDPTPHGASDKDELSMAFIKNKESYVGVGSWSTSNVVGDQLFTVRINPALQSSVAINNYVPATAGFRVYHTPLSYYGALFKQWRGGMKIRLKIVATKFHKGRLIIQYDPRNDITAVQPAENTVYTHILDIGECDDVEFEIPYHQDTAWLDTDNTLVPNWTTGSANAPRIGMDNGVFTVRVLTELTAPSSGSIGILAYTRGAEDFEFANPVDRITAKWNTDSTDPSFFNLQGQDKVELSTTTVMLGTPAKSNPNRYGMNYGESISSLRNLIHRSAVVDTVTAGGIAGDATNLFTKTHCIMPPTPGYDPNGLNVANKCLPSSGTAPYSFVQMHHIPYIAGPFIGYRGGVNIVYTPDSLQSSKMSDIRVYRKTTTHTSSSRALDSSSVLNSASGNVRAYNLNSYLLTRNGLSGMAITASHTNGSLSFNIPDYKKFNFSFASPSNYVLGSSTDGTDKQGAYTSLLIRTDTTTSSTGPTMHTELGGGVDFTCLYFLAVPTVDYPVTFATPT